MREETTEMPANIHSWPRCASKEPLGGAETILFVEDEAFVREVASEVLRIGGIRSVDRAECGGSGAYFRGASSRRGACC